MNTLEVVIVVVPLAIALLGAIAELTPNKWDNKIINAVRQVWAAVPLGTRNPKEMGSK